MSTLGLTLYVLVWPVVVLVVMGVIGYAFVREWLIARKNGEDII